MIIGQSLTAPILTGGMKSRIVVTCTGATSLTLTTPSSIVIPGVAVGNVYTFDNLSLTGTYVVTASNGSQTKTQNVLVDVVGIYTLTMYFKRYLIQGGQRLETFRVECWFSDKVTVTYNTTNVYIALSARKDTNGNMITFYTRLDVTDFTKLKMYCSHSSNFRYNRTRNDNLYCGDVKNTCIGYDVSKSPCTILSESGTNETITLDITNTVGTNYIGVNLENQSKSYTGVTDPNTVTIYDMWIE